MISISCTFAILFYTSILTNSLLSVTLLRLLTLASVPESHTTLFNPDSAGDLSSLALLNKRFFTSHQQISKMILHNNNTVISSVFSLVFGLVWTFFPLIWTSTPFAFLLQYNFPIFSH